MTGLLETGAVKDVPIWYNVYKKYPPFVEPSSERELPPQNPIPEIVYEEDFERAKRSNVINMLQKPEDESRGFKRETKLKAIEEIAKIE